MANDEYMTPILYVNLVHEVMPVIDLDPFSSVHGNSRINAQNYYTIGDGNLAWTSPWRGRIYINPPYSRGNLSNFSIKLKFEIEQENAKESISLVPNSSSEKWYQRLMNIDRMIWCLPDHRIKFTTYENGRYAENSQPESGNTFFYFGPNPYTFAKAFSKIGTICCRL